MTSSQQPTRGDYDKMVKQTYIINKMIFILLIIYSLSGCYTNPYMQRGMGIAPMKHNEKVYDYIGLAGDNPTGCEVIVRYRGGRTVYRCYNE